MIVRRLTAGDDLTAATKLLQQFFSEEDFSTPPNIIAQRVVLLAGLDTCGLFVAVENGDSVGVATVSMEFGIEFGWWAEMGDLYVLPEGRGRGVAGALVAAIEEFITARGAAGYQVTVTPAGDSHHGLMGYYRKLGFDGDGRLLLFKTLEYDYY